LSGNRVFVCLSVRGPLQRAVKAVGARRILQTDKDPLSLLCRVRARAGIDFHASRTAEPKVRALDF